MVGVLIASFALLLFDFNTHSLTHRPLDFVMLSIHLYNRLWNVMDSQGTIAYFLCEYLKIYLCLLPAIVHQQICFLLWEKKEVNIMWLLWTVHITITTTAIAAASKLRYFLLLCSAAYIAYSYADKLISDMSTQPKKIWVWKLDQKPMCSELYWTDQLSSGISAVWRYRNPDYCICLLI